MSGDATGYERASFVQPLSPDELPKDKLTMLHHAFGFSTERRDNVAYLEPGVVLYLAGNLLVTMDLRTTPPTRSYVFGVDGRGVGSFCMHPTEPLVAVGEKGNEPNVYVFKYPTWEVVHVLRKGAEQSFSCMEFSPDGNQLATVAGNPDYIITIWDWRDERITLHTKAFGQEVFNVRFSPDNPGALVTSGTGHIRFWKMARTFTGLKLQGDIGKFGKVELSDIDDFAILPDGKVLSASEAGYLLMWEGNFIKYRLARPGGVACHAGKVTHVSLLRSKLGNGVAFMSAGTDGKLCWWDFEELDSAEIDMDRTTDYEMMPVAEYSVGADVAIRTVVRSGKDGSELDPRHMLLVDENGALRRLPIEEAYEHKGGPEAEAAAAGNESPRAGAEVGYHFSIKVPGYATPPPMPQPVRPVGDEVSMAAPEPSPEYDAALAKGAEAVVTLQQFHAGAVMGMDASPVDHFCATGGADGTVRCFDYVAKTELFRDSWPGASVTALVWAPTSVSKEARAVFAGFSDGVVRVLWRGNAYDESGNPGGWTREQVFKPHNGSVTAMAFSSDGKLFATAGSDGIAFLFQSGQGAPVGAATRSYEPVGFVNVDPSAAGNNGDGNASPRAGYGTMVATSVAFRPDGLALLLTRSDGKVAEVELADLAASAAADPESFELKDLSQATFTLVRPKAAKKPAEGAGGGEGGGGGGGDEAAAAAATGDGGGQEEEEEGGEEEAPVMPLPAALAACYFKNRMNKLLVAFEGDLGGRLHEVEMQDGEAEASDTYLVGAGPRAFQKDMAAPPVVGALCYASSKQFLLTGANDGSVTVRQSGSEGSPLEFAYLRLMAHDGDHGTVTGVALSFDNNFVLSAGRDGLLMVFRLQHEVIEEAAKLGVEEHKKRVTAEKNFIPYTPPPFVPNPAALCVGAAPGAAEARAAQIAEATEAAAAAEAALAAAAEVEALFAAGTVESTALKEKEAPPEVGSVEEAADITDPSTYSIQDAKLKLEEDHRRALAEEKKAKVRARVAELQQEFAAFAEANAALTEGELKLTEDELLVDPEFAQILEEEGAELIREVERECAYGSEKASKRLEKLEARFLGPLEMEPVVLGGFGTRDFGEQRVKSFPVQKIEGAMAAVLERVRAIIRSEQLSQARAAGYSAPPGAGMGSAEDALNAAAAGGGGGGGEGGGEEGGTGGLLAAGADGSLVGSKSKSSKDEAAGEKKSTFDARKEARFARSSELELMVDTKPGMNDDDPADLKAIAYAEANMGDYRLKASEDYEVTEDMHVNSDKKMRQIVLLEENMLGIKQRFNRRVLELRGLKRQIAVSVAQANQRVSVIDAELGSEPSSAFAAEVPNDVDEHFTPELDPAEWPSERHLHTAAELAAFKEKVAADGAAKAQAPPLSIVPGLEDGLDAAARAQTEAEKAAAAAADNPPAPPGSVDASNPNAAPNAVPVLPPSGGDTMVAKALASVPILHFLGMDAAAMAPVASPASDDGAGGGGDATPADALSKLQLEEVWVRRVTLRAERKALRQKTEEHLSAFDEALYELSKERLVLSADLKAAEVRLLVALQEFEMLQGFEHRDVSMASKLDKCQREKGEVVANITEVQSRLKAKREELVRCTEEDKEINDEFLSMVPQGHAFHQQLFKIFKRKIKRSKKRDDGDDDDDDDEDDDDDDDYDDDEEDEEEEEVDDTCPPGCDTQLHESVLEQRAKRLDQEDKLNDLQKAIDELDRTLTRYEARQKQINKDLTQTESEIRRFQTEKQQKLDQLYLPVPMKLSQLCCFEEVEGAKEEGGGAAEAPAANPEGDPETPLVDLGADLEPEKPVVMPTTLVADASFETHTFFPADGLGKLRDRIVEIQEENKTERLNFKELHKTKKKLERARVANDAAIKTLEAKNEGMQMLRFGQLINMDLLDNANAGAGKEEELAQKLAEQEAKNEKEIRGMEMKSKGLKETLLQVTQENTELLSAIADLSGRQFHLEKELNSGSSGVNVNDAGPAIRSEVEERNRLVGLVKLQAKEIDALKAEINLLRRKTGHVYVPEKPEGKGEG